MAEYLEQQLDRYQTPVRTVLRPPGAVDEADFLDLCYRCGNCIHVCPVQAIQPMAREDVERAGTPYIDADLAACVVCEDLSCMKACPSGALKLVENRSQIRMGRARFDRYACVRSQGQSCGICLEQCPIGTDAIDLSDGDEIEVKHGCVGCGTCQQHCPAFPKAIIVEPAE
jgi:ferredoxin-type protein NapG